jgi:hypothetical protein
MPGGDAAVLLGPGEVTLVGPSVRIATVDVDRADLQLPVAS